ncbi:glycerol dehydrogenase [Sansalvadorimonas sp. 2012CJ34-2]|uniref:Glycerol dehydrogenase n=1 Tax=Parendozoicomonas callyspongiae TaxID=2942213 RepID=A0ABT0PJT6_9GAMM|nr:glycerol dehydrogenase [Sansalvadorimonas sp. 2012CJ34-2]MCL6271241.1 glycerol dehydrogenase [Sansalvadorimonas sp. 2012CJ34-2]
MITTAIFPNRYVQGDKALEVLGEETARLGKNALVLLDPFVHEQYGERIRHILTRSLNFSTTIFNGECCDEEIERICNLARDNEAKVIVGVGGGKVLDTSKAAAHLTSHPVVIVPSIASTDAPCSALSVIYTSSGNFDRYMLLSRNPDAVIVDTDIIAKAPTRMLVAGMGDAFATWFEADHCHKNQSGNMTGRQGPISAYALAKLCHETLLEYGPMALEACKAGVVTPALEHIVEANTLLSGIGFESGGLAAAHAIHNGLTVLPDTHGALHGEKVAIGIQAMMFLSDQDQATVDMVYDFCQAVGLPITLREIGLKDISDTDLMAVAEAACAEGETIHNEPCEISMRNVFAALKVANAEGLRRLSK